MTTQKNSATKVDTSEKGNSLGKPWHSKAVFHDFESADVLRSELLKSKKFDVKVKRLASGKFVVKERKKATSNEKHKRKKKK